MSDDPLSNTINSIPPDKLDAMRGEMFDFKTGGLKHLEAANKFQAGLDKVIDVLLVLVMKFGRATSALILGGIVLVVCMFALVIVTIQIFSLRSEVRDLLDRQEEFSRSQKRIEKTSNETQEKVESTGKAVEETQEKVKAAVDASPKVEVDKRTGKAKLVVSVPPKPRPAAASGFGAAPVASAAPRQVEIKLE